MRGNTAIKTRTGRALGRWLLVLFVAIAAMCSVDVTQWPFEEKDAVVPLDTVFSLDSEPLDIANPLIAHVALERALLPDDAAHVRHILVMHAQSAGGVDIIQRTSDAAQALAVDIRGMIADGDAGFDIMARTYSDCPSGRLKDGDIGIIRKGETPPEFETAIFALDEEEISEVIETPFGFHILQRLFGG